MRRLLIALLFAPVLLSAAGKPALFPETYPAEFKEMNLRDSEVRILAPGVTFYRYHFDDVLQFANLVHIFIRNSPEAAGKLRDVQKRLQNDDDFTAVAKEYSDAPGAKQETLDLKFSFTDKDGKSALTPEIRAAFKKLREPGDTTKPVKTKKGYYIFHNLKKQKKKVPLHVCYAVIDWDNANVKFRLAGCGKKLKKVREMVKDDNPVVAVNGAYFTWTPLATYYPFKVDGKMEMPPKGYDSKTGMCFNDGEFPVIDTEDNYDKYENVIVGYHVWSNDRYLVDGKVKPMMEEFAKGDTPLTAIGFNYETRRIVLQVVDGRFPKDAPGVNFYTESLLLTFMGCNDVLSIDGGGSCTMLIREGKKRLSDLKNHPSDNRKFDNEGARSVYNCVYVVDGDRKGRKKPDAKSAPATETEAN